MANCPAGWLHLTSGSTPELRPRADTASTRLMVRASNQMLPLPLNPPLLLRGRCMPSAVAKTSPDVSALQTRFLQCTRTNLGTSRMSISCVGDAGFERGNQHSRAFACASAPKVVHMSGDDTPTGGRC